MKVLTTPNVRPPSDLRATRMACLIELLYASGLRVSELLGLPKSAAKARQPLIAVRGKGGKERLVPISEPARAAMARYRAMLEAVAPGRAKSPWLFPADEASELYYIRGAKLSRANSRVVAVAARPRRRAHQSRMRLRHAFASHLLQNGAGSSRRPGPAWARRHFRRRKSIRMCSTSGRRRWCATCIRLGTSRRGLAFVLSLADRTPK